MKRRLLILRNSEILFSHRAGKVASGARYLRVKVARNAAICG
jgi:hypothetical protein